MRSVDHWLVVVIAVGLWGAPIATARSQIDVPGDAPTIQAAIDLAQDGDTVLVAPGTYHEAIDLRGKPITVLSVGGRDATVIDASGAGVSAVTMTSGEASDTRLEGFTITGGTGSPVPIFAPVTGGGGVFCVDAAPIVRNCRVTRNTADRGGGFFVFGTLGGQGPTVESSEILMNDSLDSGGGIFVTQGHATVRQCLIAHNEAQSGGGVASIISSGLFEDCTVTNNSATNGAGARVYTDHGTTLVFNRCRIVSNTAQSSGGGAFILLNNPGHIAIVRLIDCLIANNRAGSTGGGLVVSKIMIGAGVPLSVYATNCTIAANSARFYGGLSLVLDNGAALFRNCIIYANLPPDIYGAAGIQFTDVEGGFGGSGNIDADPLFSNPLAGDFHLLVGSPCLESGSNSVDDLPPVDWEGDPRISGGVVDMGADERHPHLYVTGDPVGGSELAAHVVGTAGSSPVLLFVGTTALPVPIPTQFGSFQVGSLLGTGAPLTAPDIPSSGVQVISAPLPPALPPSTKLYLQAFVGSPDLLLTNLEVVSVP